MKRDNHVDDALQLLQELLETQVLNEVREFEGVGAFSRGEGSGMTFDLIFMCFQICKGHKNKTLFSVKYNCYKNIGFINEEKGDHREALENLLNVSTFMK